MIFSNIFNQNTVLAVWNKGSVIINFPPNIYRSDRFGSAIKFSDYGNTNSEFGWEIDHIVPKSIGWTDDIVNLEPLNWKNNRIKSDKLI